MMNRRSLLTGGAAAAAAFMSLGSKAAKAFFLFGMGGAGATANAPGFFNVKLSPYSAKGDGVELRLGVMSSSSFPTHLSFTFDPNWTVAAFTSADIGKTICVGGAGPSGAPLVTTIASVTDSSHIILTAGCSTTVSAAIVTYGTDDTAAIQSAINAAFTAGGGLVQFPSGIYMIAGALQNTSTHNSQLILPHVADGTPQISIVLTGEIPPQTPYDILSDQPPPDSGAILFSPLNGSGSFPALLAGWTFSTTGADNSGVAVGLANLTFRTAYLNPTAMIVLQMTSVNNLRIDSVSVDVDATTNQIAATAPIGDGTHGNGAGMWMPALNRGQKNYIVDFSVLGYDLALAWGDHGQLSDVKATFCRVAYLLTLSYDTLYATRIGAYNCKYGFAFPVSASGKVPLRIDLYDTVHATTGWYASTNDVIDPSNTISGSMTYTVQQPALTFSNSSFSKSGGTNFTCTALY